LGLRFYARAFFSFGIKEDSKPYLRVEAFFRVMLNRPLNYKNHTAVSTYQLKSKNTSCHLNNFVIKCKKEVDFIVLQYKKEEKI
jgi:hypothetical protein